MAIIEGKTPPASSPESIVRVVVKLKESKRAAADSDSTRAGNALATLRRAAPGTEFEPYFLEKELRAAAVPPFDRYVVARVADREAGAALVRVLQAQALVEDAYVEGGPVPPPVNPADDPRSGNQGYLRAAPAGIDAISAWSRTDGHGVGFVDLERGWTLNHEDLAGANIALISGLSQDFHGHGTAVLGQVASVDNQRGGVGIAPRATVRVVSQWRTATNYSTAAAILSAGQAMNRGDVLLLEAQTNFNGMTNVPVEVETAVFDAIRHVVDDDGIVVIEAAGNGSRDLDTLVDAANRRILDRSSADFRDSGAIMVGAASSAAPHTRLGFSNFGNRIDCFAWGENIDTTGDGWMGTTTTGYTTSFGGTSGASPIVAGAAVLLQSWRKSRQNRVYDSETMRGLLSSPATGTPSANPVADRIGVMPDMRAILGRLEQFRPQFEKYVSFVYILFGIIDDAPGLIWVPGKGPVPVDPDWKFDPAALTVPKRDLITALAVNELAERMGDRASGKALSAAAAKAMHDAVDRIAQQR